MREFRKADRVTVYVGDLPLRIDRVSHFNADKSVLYTVGRESYYSDGISTVDPSVRVALTTDLDAEIIERTQRAVRVTGLLMDLAAKAGLPNELRNKLTLAQLRSADHVLTYLVSRFGMADPHPAVLSTYEALRLPPE